VLPTAATIPVTGVSGVGVGRGCGSEGGHFAAWEEPELFATEIRAAFKPLRK
jgi:hypothetical protein